MYGSKRITVNAKAQSANVVSVGTLKQIMAEHIKRTLTQLFSLYQFSEFAFAKAEKMPLDHGGPRFGELLTSFLKPIKYRIRGTGRAATTNDKHYSMFFGYCDHRVRVMFVKSI